MTNHIPPPLPPSNRFLEDTTGMSRLRVVLTAAALFILYAVAFTALFLAVARLAKAQNDAGQDYCASTVERWTDGQGRSQGWLSICLPDGERKDVSWEAPLGNAHFRWADGQPACLYTTNADGGDVGGGRDLDPRADGEPYLVAEIDAGYKTWLVAPGHCLHRHINYCSPPRCFDWVHPGDEGVF